MKAYAAFFFVEIRQHDSWYLF